MLDKINIQDIKDIAFKAGQAILSIYDETYDIQYKNDGSPVTKADMVSNHIICSELQKLYPNIPILSEENKEIPYTIRKHWEYFWCIDPLDGTKEFMKKNGEFAINIALVQHDEPVLGVVYAPALVTMYWAKHGEGAFKNGNKRLPLNQHSEKFTIVASKSHLSEETRHFMENIQTKKKKIVLSMGSSAKMCFVADGSIDVYPRLSSTMEWDTAAADIIIKEAGGFVLQWNSSKSLKYNKEQLINPWFVCSLSKI